MHGYREYRIGCLAVDIRCRVQGTAHKILRIAIFVFDSRSEMQRACHVYDPHV